jgi:hypothetical protein
LAISNSEELSKLSVRGAVLSEVNFVGPAWRFYSHNIEQHPFAPFSNAARTELPRFNNDDARNLIHGMVSNAFENCKDRYDESMNAIMRTLVVDQSWQGSRLFSPTESNQSENNQHYPTRGSESADLLNGYQAFRRFYARGPQSEEELHLPGIRVHQTGQFMWLLDFDEDEEAEIQKEMIPFTVAMQNAQRGRRISILAGNRVGASDEDGSPSDGFLASLPWNAEKKDIVVLFEGFQTPFVLRKVEGGLVSSQEEFQLIGDCYVHGVMDGELLYDVEHITETLGQDQISHDADGKPYAIKIPGYFATFKDFVLV